MFALVSGIGASSETLGNGRAIAKLLAQQGAIIEGTDINEVAGINAVDQITLHHGFARCSKVNVTGEFAINSWV